MSIFRKKETNVNTAPAAASASPARRKTASATRTRGTTKRASGLSEPASSEPAPQEPVSIPVLTAVSAVIVEYLPSHEEIAALAYTYWAERSYSAGCPEQDWLRAEAELRQRALATA
jgi:hypothetical protein